MTQTGALWGGRFSQGADQRFKQFNDSLRFDYRLAEQDIDGSLAWAQALVWVGVLTPAEQQRLDSALRTLKARKPIPSKSWRLAPRISTAGWKGS